MALPASSSSDSEPTLDSANSLESGLVPKTDDAIRAPNVYAVKKSSVLRSVFPFRPTREQFNGIVSSEERDRLRFEINVSIVSIVRAGRSAYLDGLGIIYSQTHCRQKTYITDDEFVVRSETVRQVRFEKCDDDSTLCTTRFEQITTTSELVHHLYPRLPVVLQLKWDEQAVRSLVRGFFQKVRADLIEHGVSLELSSIGTLYALHNRQGDSLGDRYAGADVVLRSRSEILELSTLGTFERPMLNDSYEILSGLWGDASGRASFRPRQEMLALEIDATSFEDTELEIAQFTYSGNDGKQIFAFATNGLRKMANGAGSELVVQVQADSQEKAQELARYILAFGWFLTVSSIKRALKPGLAIGCDEPLPHSMLEAVVTTRFSLLPKEHIAEDGPFHFLSLVGISAAEAKLLASGNKHHLMALLELKGFDQVNVPFRRCLLDKTEIKSAPMIDDAETSPTPIAS